jgi:excisionase family DNA binding protein
MFPASPKSGVVPYPEPPEDERAPDASHQGSPSAPEFLSVEQFAQRLGVSEKLIRTLIKKGEIHGARVGRLLRIHVSEIDRYKRPESSKRDGA